MRYFLTLLCTTVHFIAIAGTDTSGVSSQRSLAEMARLEKIGSKYKEMSAGLQSQSIVVLQRIQKQETKLQTV